MHLTKHPLSDEIPTSSMADIAFLLVIYFMITATFAATKGLDLRLPEEEETRVIDPVESVLVEVGAGGALRVDSRPMLSTALLPYLEPKLRRNPAKPVILKATGEAPYGAMVATLDLLRRGRQILDLPQEIQISLPTEREISSFWD